MTIRRIFLALCFAGTLAAQTFIQMSDPQFGMYTKNATFEHETVNFEFAIASANRLKPAFVTKPRRTGARSTPRGRVSSLYPAIPGTSTDAPRFSPPRATSATTSKPCPRPTCRDRDPADGPSS